MTAATKFPTPDAGTLAADEVLVLVTSPVDDRGRCRFTAFWIGTDHLRYGDTRAQVFHCELAEYVLRERLNLRTVTAANHSSAAALTLTSPGWEEPLDAVDLDLLATHLHMAGVEAEVLHTGANGAVLCAGRANFRIDPVTGRPAREVTAGPGWFDGPGHTRPRAWAGFQVTGADGERVSVRTVDEALAEIIARATITL